MMDMIAEDVSSWDKAYSDKVLTLYKKLADDSPVLVIKAFAYLEGITRETVMEAITNFSIRP